MGKKPKPAYPRKYENPTHWPDCKWLVESEGARPMVMNPSQAHRGYRESQHRSEERLLDSDYGVGMVIVHG